MKKILFVAMAATMFVACTQNEELENAGSNKEMRFNTAVMSTTRAGAITNELFTQFTLYAYTGADNATAIIGGKTFQKSGNAWGVTGETFYWPGTQNVEFFGYSIETAADAVYDATTATAPTLAYTVNGTIASQEDLLIAEKVTKNSAADGATVSIPFKHALTKMSFKIAGDDNATSAFSYAITGIKVTANTKGTYEYSSSDWNATTSESKDFTLTKPSDFKGGDAAVAVSEALMMIPQAGATITINYTISTLGLTNPIAVEKAFTFTDWAKGKNIAYTIKLPSNAIQKITVTGTFEDEWLTETPGTM